MSVRKTDPIKRLQTALLQRRRQLLGDLDRSADGAETVSARIRTGDLAERAMSDASLEQHYTLAEAELNELDAIDEALRLIADGRYGRCKRCGHKIRAARLRALPTATLCIRCRAELDRAVGGPVRERLLPRAPFTIDEEGEEDVRNSREHDEITNIVRDRRLILGGN